MALAPEIRRQRSPNAGHLGGAPAPEALDAGAALGELLDHAEAIAVAGKGVDQGDVAGELRDDLERVADHDLEWLAHVGLDRWEDPVDELLVDLHDDDPLHLQPLADLDELVTEAETRDDHLALGLPRAGAQRHDLAGRQRHPRRLVPRRTAIVELLHLVQRRDDDVAVEDHGADLGAPPRQEWLPGAVQPHAVAEATIR
jgi:hypothetical protein